MGTKRDIPVIEETYMGEEFGKALRAIRKRQGVTLKGLARTSGIARSYLYVLESGKQVEPSAETLNRIARVLQIEPEELYDLAWTTNGIGPQLPTMPTYFRTKYNLDDEQLATMERALKRAVKGTHKTRPKSKPS